MREKVRVVESKFKGSSSTSDDYSYIPHLAFFVRRKTESLLFLIDKDSGVGKESAQAIALVALVCDLNSWVLSIAVVVGVPLRCVVANIINFAPRTVEVTTEPSCDTPTFYGGGSDV